MKYYEKTDESHRVRRRLVTLTMGCLYLGILVLPKTCGASELFVGNFFGGPDLDVLRFNGSTGAFESVFVPKSSGGLTFPLGGAFGPDGNFYVSNSDNDTVLRYNGATGAFIDTFASGVSDAAGMAFGPDKNLYVANAGDPGTVTKLNGMTGAPLGEIKGGGLSDPEGIVFGPDGNLYVANVNTNEILRFNGSTGAFIDTFVSAGSGGLLNPRDLVFGPDGNAYVTSSGNTGGVLRYNGTTGSFLNAFVGPGSDLVLPRELVFGPDKNLYVGNFGVGDILRYNGATGAFIDTFVPAGSGGLGGPTFLVFRDDAVGAVPEPSAIGLAGLGLAGLIVWGRKYLSARPDGRSKEATQMRGLSLPLVASLAAAVTFSGPAAASTVTIGDIKDTTIFQNNVNNSDGAGPGMFGGTNGMDSPRRGLIEFDISGNIPSGSTITSVQLTLFLGQVAGTDATPRTIGLFKLADDWGEGTTGAGQMIGGTGQGFAANPGDATWNARFFSGTLWATPGGDHAAAASATATVNSVLNAPNTWLSTPVLVSDVQGWLNAPSSNFGWELINQDETTATDFRAFFTREFSGSTLRPRLQITFDAPATVPEPTSMLLLPLGMFALALGARARRRKSRPV